MAKRTKSNVVDSNTLADLVSQFAESTVRQNQSKDYKVGNLHARKRISACDSLFAIGKAGRDALAELLHDNRRDVRSMAAVYLLGYCTVASMKVLNEIAKGSDLVAFGAQMTIKGWAEGDWELDPDYPCPNPKRLSEDDDE